MSILNWMDFEDTYDTHSEWTILCGLDPIRRRPAITIAEPNVHVQFDILDLSLFLCYLFLSNYVLYKKNSICLSEQNGSGAQLWASLAHYKSRL